MNKQENISKELIESYWDGKFEIYKLTQFTDDRGMVCETFRLDDVITSEVKMCYISETEPFVRRGPHQHGLFSEVDGQIDNFISWKNNMIYEMFNPENEEFKYFITKPSDIYLIVVKPPIIHAYRNLETKRINTMNFPTSLFMGENKKQKIDEIRHEDKIQTTKTIIVLGSNGRLGKALVEELHNKVGYYNANIIPLSQRFENIVDIETTLSLLVSETKGTDVVVVNCIANTNVQSSMEKGYDVTWSNTGLPYSLAKTCSAFGWHLLCMSTDYVFQNPRNPGNLLDVSWYTKSKQQMEKKLKGLNYSKTTVVRVANLFSDAEDDTQNIVYKMWDKVNNNECITIDPEITICPTDVKPLSEYLADKLISFDASLINNEYTTINLVPNKTYKLDKFLLEFFQYTNINSVEGKILPWFDKFNSEKKDTIYNSEDTIINIVNRLKGE